MGKETQPTIKENTGYGEPITLDATENYMVAHVNGTYDTKCTTFQVGEEIRGTINAKATVAITDLMNLVNNVYTFEINEIIIGETSGAGKKILTDVVNRK